MRINNQFIPHAISAKRVGMKLNYGINPSKRNNKGYQLNIKKMCRFVGR